MGVSPANSSTNLTNRETSSGEYTVRSASLATPEPGQELGSISRDQEPDTRFEEREELDSSEQPIGEILAARGLQRLAPMLDTIGIGKVADLSCVYMEDLWRKELKSWKHKDYCRDLKRMVLLDRFIPVLRSNGRFPLNSMAVSVQSALDQVNKGKLHHAA